MSNREQEIKIEQMVKENGGKLNEKIYLSINKLCSDDDKAIEKCKKMFNEEKYIKIFRNIFNRRNPYPKEDGTDATLLEWFEFILDN